MKTFKVKWEIDIDAETPREAAEKALACQRDPESTATVFDVVEPLGGSVIAPHRIDLMGASSTPAEHIESPPGGYFVMYGYEKSADHCETLTQARKSGQKLCDEDLVPSPWSIHDADGNLVEDIKRTDGLSLEALVQNFNQSHA